MEMPLAPGDEALSTEVRDAPSCMQRDYRGECEQ